jgi:hypothetical protein
VVADELEKLKAEIRQQAPAIMQATAADQQNPPAAPNQPPADNYAA